MITRIFRKIIRVPLTIACTSLDKRQELMGAPTPPGLKQRPPQQYLPGSFPAPMPASAQFLSTRTSRLPHGPDDDHQYPLPTNHRLTLSRQTIASNRSTVIASPCSSISTASSQTFVGTSSLVPPRPHPSLRSDVCETFCK